MTLPTTPELDAQPRGVQAESRPRVERVRVLGFDFDSLTQPGLIDRLADLIARFPEDGGRPRWVATLNVNLLCLAEREPAYRRILESADVITADGMPIVWVAGLRRRPLRARVTGSDLLVPLAERAAREGWRVFLAGGAPGVAERVAEVLQERAPGVAIVGTASPPVLDFDSLIISPENRRLVAEIRDAHPDVLLAALGSPKQERWIAHHLDALAVPVSVGVGASFDFLAGRQARAPEWMRRGGLEWLYRSLVSPRRLVPRYARDALIFSRLLVREFCGGDR